MSYKYYDKIPIIGLINSGVADATGTWTTSIDLSTIAATAGEQWVNGAGAVVIRLFNKNSNGSRWLGVRIPGGTAEYLADTAIGEHTDVLVTLNNQSSIECYTENVNDVDVFLMGAYGAGWTWFQSGNRPLLSSTGSSWQSRTVSGVPANATIVTDFVGFQWRPIGETTQYTNNYSGRHTHMHLNASSSLLLNTFSTLSVKGYSENIVTWNIWKSTSFTPIIDGTWHDSPIAVEANSTAMLMFDKASSSTAFHVRPKGSIKDSTITAFHASPDETITVGTNSSGVFEYKIETGTSVSSVWILGSIDVIPQLQITAVDKLITSEISAVVLSDNAFNGTSIELFDGDVTLNVNGVTNSGIFTFTVPSWVDGQPALRYGTITLRVNNGTIFSDPFEMTILPPTGKSTIVLTSLHSSNYGNVVNFTPSLKNKYASFI